MPTATIRFSFPAPSQCGPARRSCKKANPHATGDGEAYVKYTPEEREFFWAQSDAEQAHITEVERVVRPLTRDDVPLRFKILASDVHPSVKALALKKIEGGPADCKTLQYVDALCRLPIGKYVGMRVGPESPRVDVRAFLSDMRTRLDERVYGHAEAKDHVVRLVAQWATNPGAQGLVIGLHGHMGCGKTQLAMAMCESLGMPFGFVPLGGSSDVSYLDGHSYTYEGAMWGKVADVLMRCECTNPVLFFDELDKVSEGNGGRQITNLLIHLTDPTQNTRFSDKYFMGVDIDLSRALVIFSYNDVAHVNPVLRDRIVEIGTRGYSVADKVRIATRHLLPKARAEFGFAAEDLAMDEAVVRKIVDVVVEEHGVRGLKRAIDEIAGTLHLRRIMEVDGSVALEAPTVVTAAMANEYVRTGRRDSPFHAVPSHHGMYT